MERIILQFQKNESKLQKNFTSDVKTNGKKTFQLTHKKHMDHQHG